MPLPSRVSTVQNAPRRLPAPKRRSWSKRGTVLAVEVDVEELAVPQRLGDSVREVQARHLLVPDLGVEADHLGVLELADQRQRVADGRQQDVTARLVRLRFESEAHGVTLVTDVGAHEVQGLDHPVQRCADVLARAVFGALPAAPHHEGLGAQLGREVDVAEHLRRRVATHLAGVRSEAALLEDRVAEQVRRDHLGAQTRLGQRLDVAVEGRPVASSRRAAGRRRGR